MHRNSALDDAAGENDDVVSALRLQRLDDLRHQRLVTGGQRGAADGVCRFDGSTGGISFRRLEQAAPCRHRNRGRRRCSGDHLLAGGRVHPDRAWRPGCGAPASLANLATSALISSSASIPSTTAPIDTGNGQLGAVPTEDRSSASAHLTDRGRRRGLTVRRAGCLCQFPRPWPPEHPERRLTAAGSRRHDSQTRATCSLAHGLVIDIENVDGVFAVEPVICWTPTMTVLLCRSRCACLSVPGFDRSLAQPAR